MKKEKVSKYKNLDELIKDYKNRPMNGVIVTLRFNDDLANELKQKTAFLDSIEPSISERVYYYIYDLKEIQMCPYCHKKPLKFRKINKGFFGTCGDAACKKKALGMSMAKTNAQFVHTENGITFVDEKAQKAFYKERADKAKATYKAKTGYEHDMQNPEFKKEFFKRFAENHNGVSCGVQTEKANENREKNITKKYGSTTELGKQNAIRNFGLLISGGNPQVIAKRSKTLKNNLLQRFIDRAKAIGLTFVKQDDDEKKTCHFTCDKCGTNFSTARANANFYMSKGLRFCPSCDYQNIAFRSDFERAIGDFIRENLPQTDIWSNRRIGRYESDISIPSLHLSIEANGIYWHNEDYKPKMYHQKKKLSIENDGWKLIQIWEDDWHNDLNRGIIKNNLLRAIGKGRTVTLDKAKINFRICEISEETRYTFLLENSVELFKKAKHNIGIYVDGDLTATFGYYRKNKSDECTAVQYCEKAGTTILGGFKLMEEILNNKYELKKITYIADGDWTSLNEPELVNAGFMETKMDEPDFSYMEYDSTAKVDERIGKTDLTPDELDESKNGGKIYKKVYNTGNIIFEKKEGE